jgi:hypothetical protein
VQVQGRLCTDGALCEEHRGHSHGLASGGGLYNTSMAGVLGGDQLYCPWIQQSLPRDQIQHPAPPPHSRSVTAVLKESPTALTVRTGTGPWAMWGYWCLLGLQLAVSHSSSPKRGCTPLLLQASTVTPHLVIPMQRSAQPDWHGLHCCRLLSKPLRRSLACWTYAHATMSSGHA